MKIRKSIKNEPKGPDGGGRAELTTKSAPARRPLLALALIFYFFATFFDALFPAAAIAETKMLDEYVRFIQNGKNNRPTEFSSASRYSTAPKPPSDLSEKISDEEFYEFMEMVSESENEAFESEMLAYMAKKPSKNRKAESFKFFTEYYTSNKKPGYLLFSTQDEDYGNDYETQGYSAGFSYKPGSLYSIDANYSKSSTSEEGSEDFNHQKISTALSRKFFKNFKISTNFNQLSSDTGNDLNESGLSFDSSSGPVHWGAGFSRNVYAYDAASFAAPAYYRKYNFDAGCELSDETYFQLLPAFEDYYDDGNKKREVIADLLYYPKALPDISFDIYYRTMGFSKSGGTDETFVYFTPETNTGIGISANYQKQIRKSTVFNLNLSLDREKYTYNGSQTQYYTASAAGKLGHSFNRAIRLEAKYGFSISQSSGFPFTQNAKINTTFKF